MVRHATDAVGLAAEILSNAINISVQVTLVVSMYGGLAAVCAKDYVVIRCGVAHSRITWGSVNYCMVVACFPHIVAPRKSRHGKAKIPIGNMEVFQKVPIANMEVFSKFPIDIRELFVYLQNKQFCP